MCCFVGGDKKTMVINIQIIILSKHLMGGHGLFYAFMLNFNGGSNSTWSEKCVIFYVFFFCGVFFFFHNWTDP